MIDEHAMHGYAKLCAQKLTEKKRCKKRHKNKNEWEQRNTTEMWDLTSAYYADFENMHDSCDNINNNNDSNDQSMNEENSNEEEIAVNNNNNDEEISRIRRSSNGIKCIGIVSGLKDEGVVIIFCVNFNGFGPKSEIKIDQLVKESVNRNMHGAIISLSDVRWTMINKDTIQNKLRRIKQNEVMNASDSEEEVERRKSFLKGGGRWQHCGM